MNQPLVSCIMPTANRQKYIPLAVDYFLKQDYPNTELIIVDDGEVSISALLPNNPKIKYYFSAPIGTIGLKRNYACERASGEIIMHWDDDDWHAEDWISRQVDFLIQSDSDICGIEHVHFYSTEKDTLWLGTAKNRNNPARSTQWLNGATIAYWKTYWEQHHFLDLQESEDDDFIKSYGAKVFAHDYIDGFVAILHPKNTTVKYFEGPISKM
ncbi:glycosyltransferase family 2 protein [Pedobacter sp. AW31-3R]|uniref:glycosyltransferase family 2 protein n=1 Tax=Pedobacter sp. AW31-3R TaxID=3445781 RepID=UPI003FA170B0